MKEKMFNALYPERILTYLEEQHHQGYALKEISPFTGNVTFKECQPARVVYRMDVYQPSHSEAGFFPEYDHIYLQYFQDAGWEMVCGVAPYVIFRKPVTDETKGAELELYSDRDTVYDYQKKIVWKRCLVFAVPVMTSIPNFLLNSQKSLGSWLFEGALLLAWLSYVCWQFYRLKKEYGR